MEDALRIAVIGDYNFAYHSHNATNQALQHCEDVLEIPINYYWLNERECCEENLDFYTDYDGVLIAPGPYRQPFYFQSIIARLLNQKIPVLGTGDCFKILVETYFHAKGFDLGKERIISENLIEGNYFTGIVLDKITGDFVKLYLNKATTEYSSSRFSILPQYSEMLSEGFDIGARNQFFDPEILKSKEHPFFLFTMFCPQIVSTKDVPHPIFTHFIKQIGKIRELNNGITSRKAN
jgi:CTP synthase (UTP-ammonia lyase)